jgi:hypothetical protein
MIESKKPPNLVVLLVKRAITPSHPSIIPVIKTKIEKSKKLLKTVKKKKLKIEKPNIKIVAKFGVTPILIKHFDTRITKGLKRYLSLNLEAIF